MKSTMRESFRIISAQLGDASERRFDETLQNHRHLGQIPPWVLNWYKSDKWSKADRRGTDFVIVTNRGEIRINVKSSVLFAKQFTARGTRGNGRKIIPFVVNICDDEKTTFRRFLTIVGGEYRRM